MFCANPYIRLTFSAILVTEFFFFSKSKLNIFKSIKIQVKIITMMIYVIVTITKSILLINYRIGKKIHKLELINIKKKKTFFLYTIHSAHLRREPMGWSLLYGSRFFLSIFKYQANDVFFFWEWNIYMNINRKIYFMCIKYICFDIDFIIRRRKTNGT